MRKKTFCYGGFILFSIFYLLTASRISVPGITILRWIGSFILIACSYVTQDERSHWYVYIPRIYIWIAIALVPTCLGISGQGTVYAYQRIVSLFLVLFGLELFFQNTCMSSLDKIKCVEMFTVICNCLMIYSAIFPNYANGRMTGVYQNANFLSCIASFAFASSLGFFLYHKSILKKILYSICSAMNCYCIIQSGSRMGLVLVIFTLICAILISQKQRDLIAAIKIILGIIFLVMLFYYIARHMNLVAIERFELFSESGDAMTRGDTWEDVYKIFMKKPILGWGYAQVGYNVFVSYDSTYNWGMHSSYFVILCEMGLVGSLLFLFYFIGYFIDIFNGLRYHMYTNSQRFILKTMLLCTFISLINGYSESFLFSVGNPMAICFWMPFIFLHNMTDYNKIKV